MYFFYYYFISICVLHLFALSIHKNKWYNLQFGTSLKIRVFSYNIYIYIYIYVYIHIFL